MQTIEHTNWLTSEAPLELTAKDNVLIPFAHPDDELLNAELLRRMLAAGLQVITATATNGERSTKGNPEFVRSGGRRREVERSLGFIGVRQENQYYLDLPDEDLQQPDISEQLTQNLGEIAAFHDITTIITLGTHGLGHSDHQAIHLASVRIARQQVAVAGSRLNVWALDDSHQGQHKFSFDPIYKEHIAVMNFSQFYSAPGQFEAARRQYGHLLTSHESYSQVLH